MIGGRRRGRARARHRRPPGASSLGIRVVLVAVAGLAVSCGALAARGWRVTTVGTPSMSPALPVGALVVAAPLHGPARVGQVILFRPPHDTHTYLHRVVAVAPGPTYRTKGDNDPAPDPWHVPAVAVTGRVVLVLPGLGFVVRSGGIVAAGILASLLLGWAWPATRRWIVLDVLAGALLVVAVRVHPFVDWQVVTVATSGGRSHIWLFNTGLLPLAVGAPGAAPVVVAPGHPATVVVSQTALDHLRGVAHLPVTAWALVAVACALPMLAAVVQQRRAGGMASAGSSAGVVSNAIEATGVAGPEPAR